MTPLQKLIKQFEEMKDSNLESSIDVGFAIALAKSMLEKEKEVIENAYCDGGDWDEVPQPRFENYYNAHFKTK